MSHISDERIPNNVDLAGDKKLQRALEQWQPQRSALAGGYCVPPACPPREE